MPKPEGASMDSTEFNKIAGGVLAIFLVFLLLNFASGKIYGTGEGGHHGPEVLAYAVEVETGGSAAAEEVEIDYAALVAAADPAKGEKVFNKCKSCHKVEDGAGGLGPHLWGIVNRDIGSVDGFGYSGVLTELPGNWTLQELSAFLENPKGYAKGTKMAFAGLKKPEDRVNLIVWLNEADGTPEPLE
jgi:cytochrome c